MLCQFFSKAISIALKAPESSAKTEEVTPRNIKIDKYIFYFEIEEYLNKTNPAKLNRSKQPRVCEKII
jgi:hypothetical protein